MGNAKRRSKHLMAAALNSILLVKPKTAHMQPCTLGEGANAPFGSRTLCSLILDAPTPLNAILPLVALNSPINSDHSNVLA